MKKILLIIISIALLLSIIIYGKNQNDLLKSRQEILLAKQMKNISTMFADEIKIEDKNLKSGILYTQDGEYRGTYTDEEKEENGMTNFISKKNGYGILELENGDKVLGIWEDDQLIKEEEYIYNDNSKYWGNFIEHKREKTLLDYTIDQIKDPKQKEEFKKKYGLNDPGKYGAGWKDGNGKYIDSDGNIYIGRFKNDKFDGEGSITTNNGDKVNGFFKDGKMLGKETIIFNTGIRAESQIKNDKFSNNKILFTFKNGVKEKILIKNKEKNEEITSVLKKYKSKFSNTIIYQGENNIKYKYGDEYIGETENGKKNGKGIFFTKEGDKYEGYFEDDNVSGQMIQTKLDGSKSIGEFKDNIFKNGTIIGFDGKNYYEGTFKNGLPDGEGKSVLGNGVYYKGEFKNGDMDGYGVVGSPDGTIYIGNIKDGAFNGEGTVYFPKKAEDIDRDFLNTYTTEYSLYRKGTFKDGNPDGKIISVYPSGKITEENYENGVEISSEEKTNYKVNDLNRKNGYEETDIYIGMWKDEKYDSYGIYTSSLYNSNDYKYVGEFKNGKYDGYGIIEYLNGDKYYGNWKNGKKEGIGKFYYSNSSVYMGTWKDDKYEGHGVFIYPNGDRYEGDFKDGKKEGHGIEVYSNGIYKGEFKENLPVESSTYIVKNKTVIYPNGDKYIGDFNHEVKEGYGTYIFKDGRKYEGEWKNNKYYGKGIFSWINGDKIQGEFNNNILNENSTYIFKNGDKYTGDFNHEIKEGTYYFVTGEEYNGRWDDGKFEGHGKFIWKNGDRFEGEFKNNEMYKGVYYFANGKTIKVDEINY